MGSLTLNKSFNPSLVEMIKQSLYKILFSEEFPIIPEDFLINGWIIKLLIKVILIDRILLSLLFKHFNEILLNNNPQIFGLGLIQKLPNNLIIIALKVTHGQANPLLINFRQSMQWIILLGGHKVKLSLTYVFLRLEKLGHVGNVLEKCRMQ